MKRNNENNATVSPLGRVAASTRLRKPGESETAYTKAAARFARRQYNRLQSTAEYRHAHESHAAARALELTGERFADLASCGVAGDCELNGGVDIQYLNTGDSYGLTVVYYRNRFFAGCWGDIAERT